MARLRIPKEDERGLKKLAALDDGSVEELIAALGEVSPVLFRAELASRVAATLDTIPRSDVDDIVGLLPPLYIVRERRGISTAEFAEDVCQAMDSSDDEELRLSGEARERFKERLIELLDVEAVNVGAKALELMFENQRSYASARVVTEVRPIFGSSPEDPPTGAIIIHMLKITYREQDQEKDFFVALDTMDVGTLRAALDRADLKAESLRSYLEGTRVSYIDPSEGNPGANGGT
jgi:hypothetical protein